MDLPGLWFCLIAALWLGYFVLEGFDFGVGMLAGALSEDDTDRRVMVNTIGPVWDGNEVWLVVAGGATFAAFPEWYATLFCGFYLPLLCILVALIVRGLAFEYRGKGDTDRWRRGWDRALFWGSAVPALLWGVAFANLVDGVPLDADHEFTGSLLDLLGPYALLGGVTTLTLFALHGAVFVALKTDGAVRLRARRLGLLLRSRPSWQPGPSWPGPRPRPATPWQRLPAQPWWGCSRPSASSGPRGRRAGPSAPRRWPSSRRARALSSPCARTSCRHCGRRRTA